MRKMKENACNNKNQKKNPGFLLSAVSSNSGKTAAACGLMSAFKQEGKRVCACKCGPDYIDPMFHREVLGVDSKNLDLFFSEEEVLKGLKSELYCTRGGSGGRFCSKAGMSGISSVSKSIEGTALNLPNDSLTAAEIICQIACSFSNLISVFVG